MDLLFRPFINGDLKGCAHLSVEAWPNFRLTPPENTHLLMEGYVWLNVLMSDYTEVCFYKNEIVGFLFGKTSKHYPAFKKQLKIGIIVIKFIFGKYGKVRKRFRFLFTFLTTMNKVEKMCSKFDSKIELFVVNSKYRGKGVGNILLNSFIDHARFNKKKTLYSFSDVESNWSFYEKHGFTKYKDFYDPHESLLQGERTNSFVYYKWL
jgi:GNAT superfamily N-acetyltransferase